MNRQCDKLDALLNGELAADDILRLEAHIIECEACRESIDQQRWIDGLLRSPARLEMEPAPAGISRTVRDSLLRRRKARLAACGLAAAALIVAAGWILALNRQVGDGAKSQVVRAAVTEDAPGPQPSQIGRGTLEPPRAVFVGGEDVFVAAAESRYPNVTIVRVFPTYKPSVESSDADHFNGG